MEKSETTDEKLAKLKAIIPSADTEALLDVLVCCGGNLEEAAALLRNGIDPADEKDARPLKKPRLQTQQSLSRYFGLKKSPVPALGGRPIVLHGKRDIEGALRYCTYHTNVLPAALAERLLEVVMTDERAKPNEFYLFGSRCVTNCRTLLYGNLDPADAGRVFYNGRISTLTSYNADLCEAQRIVEHLVNAELAKRAKLPFQVPAGSWRCPVAVANIYEKDSDLQWHSDRLTYIGPHAIVASLTLGFEREFRLRRVYPADSQIYSIPLAHNSVLIMHAGCQEEFKHCVPPLGKRKKVSAAELHPISGSVRVSLTFRHYKVDFPRDALCPECGYPMDLRRTYKTPSKRGHYIWICSRGYSSGNDKSVESFCKGIKYACVDASPPVTDIESEGNVWLADDDFEALNFRKS
ncbi:AFR741Wp [Eremothecium gossypii ATCC 10895]|uniref:AFR741Wp n=1 Tax=Eremothecium gossypii (strain ATCC 10895 / CBS 109.51 / FGSC 9923 / NRRL Y-1056) TaxID=284811 RepID=Q751T4_EREGS|nr:AFR741Wp [Eremothecium gossypii ATCC 10895]AAS54113.1 AFR741Wp [Eremothecium gossypii ATCC 10895]AEY98429.1 FAFR741Wp [Eremothecium gossypii FDAG1]